MSLELAISLLKWAHEDVGYHNIRLQPLHFQNVARGRAKEIFTFLQCHIKSTKYTTTLKGNLSLRDSKASTKIPVEVEHLKRQTFQILKEIASVTERIANVKEKIEKNCKLYIRASDMIETKRFEFFLRTNCTFRRSAVQDLRCFISLFNEVIHRYDNFCSCEKSVQSDSLLVSSPQEAWEKLIDDYIKSGTTKVDRKLGITSGLSAAVDAFASNNGPNGLTEVCNKSVALKSDVKSNYNFIAALQSELQNLLLNTSDIISSQRTMQLQIDAIIGRLPNSCSSHLLIVTDEIVDDLKFQLSQLLIAAGLRATLKYAAKLSSEMNTCEETRRIIGSPKSELSELIRSRCQQLGLCRQDIVNSWILAKDLLGDITSLRVRNNQLCHLVVQQLMDKLHSQTASNVLKLVETSTEVLHNASSKTICKNLPKSILPLTVVQRPFGGLMLDRQAYFHQRLCDIEQFRRKSDRSKSFQRTLKDLSDQSKDFCERTVSKELEKLPTNDRLNGDFAPLLARLSQALSDMKHYRST